MSGKEIHVTQRTLNTVV